MKLDHKMKQVSEALNAAIVTAFEATERKKTETQRKADSKELNKQLIRQEGILNRNKEILTPEEYGIQKKSIESTRSFRESMDKDILNKVNVYNECSNAALKYIKATKEVSSNFGDVVVDIDLFNKDSTQLLEQYIQEAKDQDFYCEQIHSKDISNNVMDKRESYLMHNEAYKHITDRIYNSGNEISITEKAFFVHFDPRVDSQFYDLDQTKKLDHFKKIAQDKSDAKEFFGMGRTIASRSIGGRELFDNDTPSIQFREDLTNYLEDLAGQPYYQSRTLNIKSALKEDGKELDILNLAKADISEFFDNEKPKQTKKRTLR